MKNMSEYTKFRYHFKSDDLEQIKNVLIHVNIFDKFTNFEYFQIANVCVFFSSNSRIRTTNVCLEVDEC